jgi:hypothetical protein
MPFAASYQIRYQHDALRTYAYATDSSINEAVLRALADFLAAQGRQEEVDAFLKGARKRYPPQGCGADAFPDPQPPLQSHPSLRHVRGH